MIPYKFYFIFLAFVFILPSCFRDVGDLVYVRLGNAINPNNAIASWKASLPIEFSSKKTFWAGYPKAVISEAGQIIITWGQSDGVYEQIFYSFFDGITWHHPSSLSDNISPDGQDALYPEAAINNDGKIVITWMQSDRKNLQIFYSYFDGYSWHQPFSLSDNISTDGQDTYASFVTMNSDGKIVITWTQSDGANYQIFYSQFNGDSWHHPLSLSDNISPDGQNAVFARPSINSAGKVVIIWEQSDGAKNQVFNSYFDGNSWHHPSSLNDNISPEGQVVAYSSDGAFNNNGEIVITWAQSDGAKNQIYYSRFDGLIWHHPSSLNDNISPDGQDASKPKVRINNDGKIVIIWTQSDGANKQIYKSYFNGVAWHQPSSLNDNISPDGQDASYPEVAMNNEGKIVITWTQSDGANNQIFYSYFDGVSWLHPASLNDNISPDGQDTINQKVAMNSEGKIVITWAQSDGSNKQIYYSYFNGVNWYHPPSLSENISPDGQDAFFPQVAVNSEGNIVITWQQSDGAKNQIYYSYFDGASWHHPLSLSDHISLDGQDASFPQVAMNSEGKIVITWKQFDGTHGQIYYSYFDGDSWHHPLSLSDHISPNGQDANRQKVAMNSEGKIVITWYQWDSHYTQIYYSYFDGVSWHHPTSLSDNISPDGKSAYSPEVTINNNGKIVITWEQSDGSNQQIYYSYFNGLNWDHPTSLSDNVSPDDKPASNSQVVINDEGKIVITWQQSDGVSSQIFYSYFNGISWHHSSSLSDNISPDGQNAYNPKVAMNSDGKIIITWTQYAGANGQIFYSYFDGTNWKHPNSVNDYSLPGGAIGCYSPTPLITDNIKKIMMSCYYKGMYRLYEIDGSKQFIAGDAADYLSSENESVGSLSGKIVSDTMAVLTYQSTYHSPTISPIKYILWGLD